MGSPTQLVRSLFKPPFTTAGAEGRAIFIYDNNINMAASRDVRTDRPVPRGYGRHQYLPNGDALHYAWCTWFHANVPEKATLEETAEVLNSAWAEGA